MTKAYRILQNTAITFFLVISTALGNEPLKPYRTAVPPIIDGELDDIVWQKALQITEFKTFSPDFGHEPYCKTVAYSAYDSDNLYFAFNCFDHEPDKIRVSMNTRDSFKSDDWVCINLDTFNDQQSLYAFYVNPFGIQGDSRYAAGLEDFSSDFVWYSAGKTNKEGYTVEIRIPLKSIRFAEANPVLMSLFFERFISRQSEHNSFPEFDAAKGYAFLQQMQPVEFHNLNHSDLFEIIPAFTYSRKYNSSGGGGLLKSYDRGELSLTSKFGITSDLILDAAYNPDFSQIEADAGQVDINLRYALFYPEKRPFFLEGNEIFNIAGTSITDIDPVISLFHTRTIVNPLAGIKLSGKIGIDNTLSLMYSVDELSNSNSPSADKYSHFPVLRYKRSLWDDSYVGVIYTGSEQKSSFNRAGGIDGILRVSGSSSLQFNTIYSSYKKENFEKALGGYTAGINLAGDSRDIYYSLSAKTVSEDFTVSTGYITRTGFTSIAGLIKPKFYPESSFFQRIELSAFTAQSFDTPSKLWETSNEINLLAYFLGSFVSTVRYFYSTEIYNLERFKTDGFKIQFGGLVSTVANFSVLYGRANAINYIESTQGKSNLLSVAAIFNPTDNIELTTDFTYVDFYRSSDSKFLYDYTIIRQKMAYQFNKYLFFRGIVEYNDYRKRLLTDFLLSFTYVPGTVIYLGYGSLYEKQILNSITEQYDKLDSYKETVRGFFVKLSYLWRL